MLTSRSFGGSIPQIMTIVVGTTRTLEILKSPVVLSKAKMSHGVCGHTMQAAKCRATPDPILGVEAVGDQRLWRNAVPEHHSFSMLIVRIS